MAEQSSVICIASFAAFVSAPFMRSASKTCGVCTRTVLLRSTVPVTLPSSSTAFSVSVLGMTGMEDICTLASYTTRLMTSCVTSGRAPSCIAMSFAPFLTSDTPASADSMRVLPPMTTLLTLLSPQLWQRSATSSSLSLRVTMIISSIRGLS